MARYFSEQNKQIEEMAKTINKSDILCHTCGESTYTYCAEAVAEYLHANGYRKTTDVAREIFEEIEDCMRHFEDDDDGYLLKKCEFEFFMRELKKKYTEGGGLNEL